MLRVLTGGRCWRFAVAGVAVATTAVLVLAGQPRVGVLGVVRGLGLGLVVGLLVNVPWMVFAAAAWARRPAFALTGGWVAVQVGGAAVSWSLSGPLHPPAGDWLLPCFAVECIALVTAALIWGTGWRRRRERWLAAAVSATVLAGCVGCCASQVDRFMSEVGDGSLLQAHASDATYLPLPDGLVIREFAPPCRHNYGLCDLGYAVWDRSGADRNVTMARLTDQLRRNGWPISEANPSGCTRLRGIFDWNRVCARVRAPGGEGDPLDLAVNAAILQLSSQ
jgi:hypothetical protein